jgi:hypothetical protein
LLDSLIFDGCHDDQADTFASVALGTAGTPASNPAHLAQALHDTDAQLTPGRPPAPLSPSARGGEGGGTTNHRRMVALKEHSRTLAQGRVPSDRLKSPWW